MAGDEKKLDQKQVAPDRLRHCGSGSTTDQLEGDGPRSSDYLAEALAKAMAGRPCRLGSEPIRGHGGEEMG